MIFYEDPDPNFHVDADPDPHPDWQQYDADPHTEHVGKSFFYFSSQHCCHCKFSMFYLSHQCHMCFILDSIFKFSGKSSVYLFFHLFGVDTDPAK
jgi:hypothetical protein